MCLIREFLNALKKKQNIIKHCMIIFSMATYRFPWTHFKKFPPKQGQLETTWDLITMNYQKVHK